MRNLPLIMAREMPVSLFPDHGIQDIQQEGTVVLLLGFSGLAAMLEAFVTYKNAVLRVDLQQGSEP